MNIALDCKHYRGDRPCKHRGQCRCLDYESMGMRILIIKLGALGDVVRTASLLPTLKRTYPESHITWATKPNGVRILSGHPLIDQLVTFDTAGVLALTGQRFDLVLSCDKEPGPAALCNAIDCNDKRGISLSRWGTVGPANSECEPYFKLGLDDELKFKHNMLSYPELIHTALGLKYTADRYRLYCDPTAKARALRMFQPWRNAADGPVIGMNTGSGSSFANKALRSSRWVEVGRELINIGYTVVLLGGPDELEDNAWIVDHLGWGIYSAGCDNSEQEFVAVVDQCDVVITGDTLALHVALARAVSVVAIFGPTCEQEIEMFGLGTKIVSGLDCGPCYRRQCQRTPTCMDAVSAEEIVDAVVKICEPADALIVKT